MSTTTRAPSTLSSVIPAEPSAVRQARELVRGTLKHWRVDTITDDVVLVASELVANALLHGVHGDDGDGARVELNLVSTGSHLICAVSDPNPTPPVRQAPDDASSGGRGLHLIEALSMCWGWTPARAENGRRAGKSVWAIFPLERIVPTRAAAPLPVTLRAG